MQKTENSTETIESLAARIYAVNEKNGFWNPEKPMPAGKRFGLICGEAIGEALEADRKNKPRATPDLFEEVTQKQLSLATPAPFPINAFENFIKDTLEDEIADSAIRLLDTVFGLKLPFASFKQGSVYMEAEFMDGCEKPEMEIGALLMAFNFQICVAWKSKKPETRAFYLGAGMEILYAIAGFLKFNLDWHINAKLAYNATRPFMHNKLY